MVKTITFQVTVALVYLHSQDIVLVDVDPTVSRTMFWRCECALMAGEENSSGNSASSYL